MSLKSVFLSILVGPRGFFVFIFRFNENFFADFGRFTIRMGKKIYILLSIIIITSNYVITKAKSIYIGFGYSGA